MGKFSVKLTINRIFAETERYVYLAMALREHIDDIRNNLEQGLFTNEAAVSNGIVRRLLDALAWPIYNPLLRTPYSVNASPSSIT